jgi:hypothetical protein
MTAEPGADGGVEIGERHGRWQVEAGTYAFDNAPQYAAYRTNGGCRCAGRLKMTTTCPALQNARQAVDKMKPIGRLQAGDWLVGAGNDLSLLRNRLCCSR